MREKVKRITPPEVPLLVRDFDGLMSNAHVMQESRPLIASDMLFTLNSVMGRIPLPSFCICENNSAHIATAMCNFGPFETYAFNLKLQLRRDYLRELGNM